MWILSIITSCLKSKSHVSFSKRISLIPTHHVYSARWEPRRKPWLQCLTTSRRTTTAEWLLRRDKRGEIACSCALALLFICNRSKELIFLANHIELKKKENTNPIKVTWNQIKQKHQSKSNIQLRSKAQ